jgi:hypothetical protein
LYASRIHKPGETGGKVVGAHTKRTGVTDVTTAAG